MQEVGQQNDQNKCPQYLQHTIFSNQTDKILGPTVWVDQIELQTDGANERKEHLNELDVFEWENEPYQAHNKWKHCKVPNVRMYIPEEGKGKYVNKKDGTDDKELIILPLLNILEKENA